MRIMDRDRNLIRWINGWGFVTVAQVAKWMVVDFSTAARRTRSLVDAKLLRKVSLPLVTVSPLVPTALGCEIASDYLPPVQGIRLGTFHHDRTLINAARVIVARFGGDIEPARRIRHGLGPEDHRHVPDGLLHRRSRMPVAIELELTAKGRRRLQSIVEGYLGPLASGDLEQVWYLTDGPEVARAIKRASGGDPNIRVIPIGTHTSAVEPSQASPE